jgi:multimeric flavodoxin WrbA
MVQQVLAAVTEAGLSTEFMRIAEKEIGPCDACWTCAETGFCRIEDEMQEIYPKLTGSAGLVIGSPTHMGYSVSGQGQVFLDRTFSLWHKKRLANKVGASVVVSNRRGGISAVRVINSVFLNHNVIIAGFANGYGRDPGDVRKDKRALTEAVALGERISELIRVLRRK